MINFLKDILAHSDDIAYGAGSELYNKMVVDTEDRHKKFTRWGNEVQNSLNLRKVFQDVSLVQGNLHLQSCIVQYCIYSLSCTT